MIIHLMAAMGILLIGVAIGYRQKEMDDYKSRKRKLKLRQQELINQNQDLYNRRMIKEIASL